MVFGHFFVFSRLRKKSEVHVSHLDGGRLLNQPKVVYFLLSLATTACITSGGAKVSQQPTIKDDKQYHEALTKFSRRVEIVQNFENVANVSVTLLSPGFVESFSNRFQTLFGQDQPFSDNPGERTIFFVSIFAPSRAALELDNASVWSLSLQSGKEVVKPMTIKKLTQKERWQPFFSDVNQWSMEYMVVFDKKLAAGVSNKEMVKSETIQLVLANAQAKVAMDW